MSSPRIPDTDSVEELAQFWDTHEITDFEDQLQEVAEPVFVPEESATVPIKLNATDVKALKRIAESEGVRETTLLRRWVLEHLRKSS